MSTDEGTSSVSPVTTAYTDAEKGTPSWLASNIIAALNSACSSYGYSFVPNTNNYSDALSAAEGSEYDTSVAPLLLIKNP